MAEGQRSDIIFRKLSDRASDLIPILHRNSVFHLFSAVNVTIPPFQREVCMTDLQIILKAGLRGFSVPIQRVLDKRIIAVNGGIIQDYDDDNFGIILQNLTDCYVEVSIGEPIAALIVEKIDFTPTIEEVPSLPTAEFIFTDWGTTGLPKINWDVMENHNRAIDEKQAPKQCEDHPENW
jgi:dUTPase